MKTGNHHSIRDINTSILIEQIIANQPISRIELANLTRLNKSTVTRIVNDLLEREIVLEGKRFEKLETGRKAIELTMNQNAGFAIGIEMDHKKMYGILTNLVGEILFEYEEDIMTIKQEDVIHQLILFIKKITAKQTKSTYGIVGIAIGIHGMVNEDQLVQFAPYLQWKNVDLYNELKNHFNYPLFINNEANYSVLGEHIFANHYKNMMILNIKTGIGMGIILNNKLYNGKLGFAGEIGHMIIEPSGLLCPCGNKGCFEQYASEDAYLKKLTNHNKELVEEEIIHYLSIGINNILTIFNPDAIIINSQRLTNIPNLTKRISVKLTSNMNVGYELVLSSLGKKACVLGGVSTVIKNFYDIKYIKLLD